MHFDSPMDVSAAQSSSLAWLIAPICGSERPNVGPDEVFAQSWQSIEMAQQAATMAELLAGQCQVEEVLATAAGEVRCVLIDGRDRRYELLVSFESPESGRVTRVCTRPVLPAEVDVRAPGRRDLASMARLEALAPVQRDDGTQVFIDHNGRQFDHSSVLTDHRWLAAFHGDTVVAVQGVALASAPIGGTLCRIAYNHYSRSDPQTRQGGNVIHLITTLYRDVYPEIDQFVSLVDVQNATGLRLSFGTPWPTLLRRLFLPVAALAALDVPEPTLRTGDLEHAAAVMNATHAGMNLWVPRTAEFLRERQRRAPDVYPPAGLSVAEHAALAVWNSGETRTYARDGHMTVRRLALALDYGFTGEPGRREFEGLLRRAATELLGTDASHIALFISDNHPPTRWLLELADHVDTYAACAPSLQHPPPPTGPTYVDQIIF
jgi:hypothetical protein